MTTGTARLALIGLLSMVLTVLPARAQGVPDISGVWMPAAELAEPWQPASLPLTAEARSLHEEFDPRRRDSTLFCMPLGTPRNMLSTAAYPIEILQRPERITMVFDRLGDVRRIFLDGRSHPDEPVPGWMGHSVGRWLGDALLVETVALTDQSILDDEGVPHSDQLRVSERFTVTTQRGEQMLVVDMELTDPRAFTAAMKTRRYFRRAPHVVMSEGSGLCLLDQWRKQLERTNSGLAAENRRLKATPEGKQ